MAYKKQDIIDASLKAIKKHNLTNIVDIIPYIKPDRATFYRHNCDKCDTIKEALSNNKITLKAKLKRKWLDSDNATLNIALYKLLATDEEREILNNNSLNVNLFQDKKFEIIEDDGDDTEHDKDK